MKQFVVSLMLAMAVMPAASQTPPTRPASLRFAVASVKPVTWQRGLFHGGSCHGIDSNYRPEVNARPVPLGRCGFENAALGNIIRFAHQERERPPVIVSGGDKWIWSDAFEVVATAENTPDTTEEQLRLMLQALLRERFNLQFHKEVHDEQGFALMKAGNGRNLNASKANQSQTGPIYIRREGAQLFVTGEQVTIESLVDFLSGNLQQPIQDETGLEGDVYAIAVHFIARETNGNAPTARAGITESPGPSLFTALQEQLGLKLEPRKIRVHMIVIDHAEKPSEN